VNPTNGSWWMLQILSTKANSAAVDPTAVGAIPFGVGCCRKDLKYPPTAVVGIQISTA